MKNKILMFGISTLCVFIMAGCGGPDNSHDDHKLVLALRSGAYADVVRGCLSEFEKENEIVCEIVEFSEDDLHNVILNDSVGGTGSYDICMTDSSWTAELLSNEILSSLSALGYEFDDDIIKNTTNICTRDGEIYLVPYYGNVTVMLYNKSLMKESDSPRDGFGSLADVRGFCEYAVAKGKKGFIYRGDTSNNIVVDFLPILCAHGGWVVDGDNRPTVNTPEFKAAMYSYMDLIGTGEALTKDDMINAIETGEGVVGIGWPGWCHPSEDGDIYYCAVPDRIAADSEHYNTNIYGIWTMGITSNSEHKEEAIKLIRYLMDPDIQKQTMKNGGVPCRYSCLKDEEILKEYPYYKEICDALENGIYRPDTETWPQFYEILGEQMEKIMQEKISVEDGLKVAQEELESIQ